MTDDWSDPLVQRMVVFVREIGLAVRRGPVQGRTFVPGVWIDHGVLVVDEPSLRYPGDLLHEAGHLAVIPAERRATIVGDVGSDPAEELMAIGWSYAAALHLEIDPAVVFHPAGYRDGAQSLLENFAAGRFMAVPMLQWLGLCYDERQAAVHGVAPYPHMLRWLRPA